MNRAAGFATHPRTGRPQPPKFLGGAEPQLPPGTDRREAYAWLPADVPRSKVAVLLSERKLGVTSTVRNWNTVTRLLALADG